MGFSLSRLAGDVFSVATLGQADNITKVFTLGAAESPRELEFFVGDVLTGGALSQKKATKEQRKALAVQARIASVQNARKRRQAIAAQRRTAATATASAASSGGLGSSGLAGFQAGATTATAANVSFQQGLSFLESRRIGALSRSAKFQGDAALSAGINSAIRTAASVA